MQTPAGPPSVVQGTSFPVASKHMTGPSVAASAGSPASFAQAFSVQAIMPPAVQLQVLHPSELGNDAPTGKGLLSYRHSTPASVLHGMTLPLVSKQGGGGAVPASPHAEFVMPIRPSSSQVHMLQRQANTAPTL